MSSERGFSLIELLIVVTIIIIIASMAIPNLLRARIAANEASAAASIRTINAAQLMYECAYPQIGYADALSKLGPGGEVCKLPSSDAGCMIDSALAGASTPGNAKSGYYFAISADKPDNSRVLRYTAAASASVFNKTGVRDFCSTEDNVIHFRIPSEQSTPEIAATECSSWLDLQ